MLQPPETDFTHTSVLLNETVAALTCDADLSGVFVDATFGRGGHTCALLAKLNADAQVFVFDKDPEAVATAQALAAQDVRVRVIHDSFANISEYLAQHGVDKVDGMMADLGVSSPQLDDGARGFSFMREGAVDMRMDTTRGEPASAWLTRVSEEALADVLYEFGEERYSRRIAKAIKAMDDYGSTLSLAETIKAAHPNWEKGRHPATKSFQAIRIHINNELHDVDAFLEQSIQLLKEGGTLAVISFHSLEDRRIKQFMQRHSRGRYPEDENLPFAPNRPKYFAKPKRIKPSSSEVAHNLRARSAYLRVAKRSSMAYE